jgi:NAD-dependent SIR2 family protein deacetylase
MGPVMIEKDEGSGVEAAIERAARAIDEAEALLVTAGAGMGVDSGLPDFRGDQGFWKAYPAYGALGLSFVDLANPRWFATDPELAWGFYGHRLNLYRGTRPHRGFELLGAWAAGKPLCAFAFTSNVDGQFQAAGWSEDRIVECHGRIGVLQCTSGCGAAPFPAPGAPVAVDEATFRAARPLPACPACGGLARPNILMFGDGGWDSDATDRQETAMRRWLAGVRARGGRLAIVECGAGSAVPTVRFTSERIAANLGPAATLVRVNLREPEAPPGAIALALGAREALERIEAARRSGAGRA